MHVMKWQIGRHDDVSGWTILGESEGSNPQAALEHWIDREEGASVGEYGVQVEDRWHLFSYGTDGIVKPL
jgi:hypothetical protein